jgi:hypothetical protein
MGETKSLKKLATGMNVTAKDCCSVSIAALAAGFFLAGNMCGAALDKSLPKNCHSNT